MLRKVAIRAGVAAAVSLWCWAAPLAQEWSGQISGGYRWQDVEGSEGGALTQAGEREGWLLEAFTLNYRPDSALQDVLWVKAWGFGGADPTRHARLVFRPGREWQFELSYDRNQSYFRLFETELGHRADSWEVSRWKGKATWDGWSAARLTLTLRRVERDGHLFRRLYALNDFYASRVDLDEVMEEASLRLETKTLPVHLVIEQAYAQFERENRWKPVGSVALDGIDPDLLARLETTREEEVTVPTTRVTVAWNPSRFELAGSLIYSPADIDATGSGWRAFDIGGGTIGRLTYLDHLTGSAEMDTLVGNFRAGVDLASGWLLRLYGDYRDASADSTLLGERILRAGSPGGTTLDFTTPIGENGRFDVTDRSARFELEKRLDRWTFWGGGFAAQREVDWRRTAAGEAMDVRRDSDGVVLGASWSSGPKFKADLEWEHGAFERYIFRTDPESVDRLTLRVRSDLGKGWQATAHARTERSDNPAEEADYTHRSSSLNLALGWNAPDGKAAFAFDLNHMDITTDTDLVLPGGGAGLSRYDLGLWTMGLRGNAQAGPVRLEAAIARVDDRGETWPMDMWTADAQATLEGPGKVEYSAFFRYRSYDENLADRDDFDLTQYGLLIRWRF